MRLLEVGGIVLDEPLFFADEFVSNRVLAKSEEALDGSEIVFEAPTRNEALYFTHKDTAWQSKTTLNRLIDLANYSMGKVLEIKTEAGKRKVRFDYTKKAVVGNELFVGSNHFLVEIYFKGV